MTPITLKNYYLLFLPPLFVGMLLMRLLHVEVNNGIFLWLGYCWPLLVTAPGIEEKALSQSYSYSFVKVIYLLHLKITEFFNKKKKHYLEILARGLSPVLFTVILVVIFGKGNPVFTFAGVVVFESVIACREFYLKYKSGEKNEGIVGQNNKGP